MPLTGQRGCLTVATLLSSLCCLKQCRIYAAQLLGRCCSGRPSAAWRARLCPCTCCHVGLIGSMMQHQRHPLSNQGPLVVRSMTGVAEGVLPFSNRPLLGLYGAARMCSRVLTNACAYEWAVVLPNVKACKPMLAIWC